MSAVRYVSGLWKRCIATVRWASDHLDGTSMASAPDDVFGSQQRPPRAVSDPALFVYAQAFWMAVTLALLTALSALSARLYFVVSFIGLLLNRLLFAPRERVGRWWHVVSVVTWLCFAVLGYLIYLRVEVAMAATGSA